MFQQVHLFGSMLQNFESRTVNEYARMLFMISGTVIMFLFIHSQKTDYCVQSGNINYELGRNFQTMHMFAAFISVLVNTQVGIYLFHFCEVH